jgi:hypothetical protein
MSRPPNAPFDPKREEVFHIAGDPDHGFTATTRLDRQKREVQVRYKDFLMVVDVYAFPDTPIRAILVCPRCKNTLTIQGDKKRIDYDPNALTERGGQLQIEPFGCTWEADPNGRRMEFGLGLCGWKVGISNNVAKDA